MPNPDAPFPEPLSFEQSELRRADLAGENDRLKRELEAANQHVKIRNGDILFIAAAVIFSLCVYLLDLRVRKLERRVVELESVQTKLIIALEEAGNVISLEISNRTDAIQILRLEEDLANALKRPQ